MWLGDGPKTMQMGVGLGQIDAQGQLQLPVTFEYEKIVTRGKPVYWSVACNGTACALSRHRATITDTLDCPVVAVTIPDPDLSVAVPVALLDDVTGLSTGEAVVFVLTDDLAYTDGILVVPRASVGQFDPGLASIESSPSR